MEKKIVRRWLIESAEGCLLDLYKRLNFVKNKEILQIVTLKLNKLLAAPFPNNVFIIKNEIRYIKFLQQQIEIVYTIKEFEMELIEIGLCYELEKTLILREIDAAWTDHLQQIEFLQESVRWVAYGQKDPLTEYKNEAFNYFNIMSAQIRHYSVNSAFRLPILFF